MELAPETVESYETDGVVVLRGLLGPRWLELLDAGVERNLAEPSQWAQHYTPQGEPGQFFGDYCSWNRIPEFRQVAFDAGLADAARQLMRSDTVRFFHEHVLVKEPGTREVTPWHHDQPYYCVDGDQNVSFWVPLDPVPAAAGVEFVAGSTGGVAGSSPAGSRTTSRTPRRRGASSWCPMSTAPATSSASWRSTWFPATSSPSLPDPP